MNLTYQQRIVVDFARFDARQLFYLCFQQHVPKQYFSHMMASSTFQMSLFSTFFEYNNTRPANERVIMPVKFVLSGRDPSFKIRNTHPQTDDTAIPAAQ